MKYYLIDVLFSFFVEYLSRITIRDALYYKRNKSNIKKLKKEISVIRHIFRIYPKSLSFAPRHLSAYLWRRFINLILLSLSTFAYFAYITQIEALSMWILIIKSAVIYFPFYLYDIFLMDFKGGSKSTDFSKFKNP